MTYSQDSAPAGQIRGIVVDTKGAPLADQRLEVRGSVVANAPRLVAFSSATGEFTVGQLPLGTYTIELIVEGRAATSKGPLVLTAEAPNLGDVIIVRPPEVTPSTPVEPFDFENGLTANPFFLLAHFFNLEYERKRTATTTWGIAGTLSTLDEFRYRTAKALFRVYPGGTALRGGFLGARAGVSRVSDRYDDTGHYFTLGGELGYSDVKGRRLVGSIGLGVNRLFGVNASQPAGPLGPTRTWVAIRANIGVVF